ncbi:ATP-binding protein [Desulfonauticus submarinus]
MLTIISLCSFATGILILFILFILNKKNKRYYDAIKKIFQLSETNFHDIEEFLNNSINLLKPFGIINIDYNISYFDLKLSQQKKYSLYSFSKEWKQGETYINLKLYFKTKPKGENKLLIDILLDILINITHLIISHNYIIIQQTFKNIDKINTFILHDVKNISQFILFLQHNVQSLDTIEEKNEFIVNLKKSLPSLYLKSSYVLNCLQKTKNFSFQFVDNLFTHEYISIKSILNIILNNYKLNVKINGSIFIEKKMANHFMIIIDNIIKNIYEKSLTTKLKCYIIMYETDTLRVIKIMDTGGNHPQIQKIFQPFYSTKRNGLGIGLYHSLHIAQRLNADLSAKNINNGVMFKLTMKKDKKGA